jgi:hypothetical protein
VFKALVQKKKTIVFTGGNTGNFAHQTIKPDTIVSDLVYFFDVNVQIYYSAVERQLQIALC